MFVIAGDRYQRLVAWQRCVTAVRDAELRAPNAVVAVGVEVDGVGNVDDVVLYRKTAPHTYMQVKYAADSSTAGRGSRQVLAHLAALTGAEPGTQRAAQADSRDHRAPGLLRQLHHGQRQLRMVG
ncbi:hypothetical protein ACFY1U_48920 [Streptomyces sp. NPDC001351]|uniref:hypothetical protein n=1 Tax=Streptomyces sp. NPDC001351 TaxID=3364564 RepID=UPI0036753451